MIAQFAELLPASLPPKVHEKSLDVLEHVGLLVRNEKACDRFRRHGCKVAGDTRIVTFPRHVVEEFRAMIPPAFTFHARNEAFSRSIPRDALVVATASSAPDMLDPETGEERRSRSGDIARIAHLVNQLDGIDVFSISVLADDAPPDQFSLSRFYPAVKNCWKPVRTSVVDEREARQVIKLGSKIAGSEQRFRERPFITFGYCSIVSPLTMDFDSTEMLMFFAENGLPAYGTLAPIGGISAPLKMSGMLVQMNAEWHAAAVLAQMGRHYGYPTGSYLGLTNAKVSDAQAGYEKAMSPTLAATAGIDFVVVGGLLDALMAFDFGQLVIDSEIALMLKRFRQHLSFGDLEGVLDEIGAAGPAGMYVGNAETLKLMKSCALLPEIADRERREVDRKSVV